VATDNSIGRLKEQRLALAAEIERCRKAHSHDWVVLQRVREAKALLAMQ
jgi:hypothetical protein